MGKISKINKREGTFIRQQRVISFSKPPLLKINRQVLDEPTIITDQLNLDVGILKSPEES